MGLINMNIKQIEMVFLIVIVALILSSVLFTRKGISMGFKLVKEDKKKSCKTLRNKILIFYAASTIFLLSVKMLEILVRSVDFGVDTFNLLTTICISGAVITFIISFVCLWRWCKLRCKKAWPWLWGFTLGVFSIVANIYLVFEVVRNCRDKKLEKT